MTPGSRSRQSQLFSPYPTTSGMPPVAVATSGAPAASASAMTVGMPSARPPGPVTEGTTATRQARG